MTAYGTIESAVEAMRLGAFDYIQKPFTEQELLVKVAKALDNRQPRRRGRRSSRASSRTATSSRTSSAARAPCARCSAASCASRRPTPSCSSRARAAPARSSSRRRSTPTASAPTGPSSRSTAPPSPRRSSRASSSATPRARSPAPSSARKGLFEEADGGTFFFDEIAETPLTFQAKLLRAIQENEIRRVGENKPIHVDVRIIAATNQDLLDRRRREALPPGPLLPAQRRALPAPAAARAPRGHPGSPQRSSSRSTTRKMGAARRSSHDSVLEALIALRLPGQRPRARAHDRAGGRPRAERRHHRGRRAAPAASSPARRGDRAAGARWPTWSTPPSARPSRAALRESEGSRESAAELLEHLADHALAEDDAAGDHVRGTRLREASPLRLGPLQLARARLRSTAQR